MKQYSFANEMKLCIQNIVCIQFSLSFTTTNAYIDDYRQKFINEPENWKKPIQTNEILITM